MQLLFESLFNGVAIGSVLLVAALGLAIVFGLMGVINLAHGELIMLGAYTTYVVQLIFKLPALQPVYNLYVLVAIPIAFITSGVVGILLERTVIRRLYGSPLETLLATWGVSLILQQFVRSVPLAQAAGVVLALVLGFSLPLVLPQDLLQGPRSRWVRAGSWGVSALAGVLFGSVLASQISKIARATSRNVDVTAPKWMRGGIEFMDLTFPVPRLVIIVITILAVVGVTWFLNRSVWGMRIRAVTQNREMSDCLGIPTDTVDVLTFGIGSGLAGIAGVAVSLLGSVGPNVGTSYIVGCFMVVVLGGVGNLLGTVIASFAIGLLTDLIGAGRLLTIWPDMPAPLESTVQFFATTSMAQVLVFALIVVFLQFRPAGLFPQKGRMVEA
ncbi:ABC-type urea transporter/ permease component [Synechococcus sp. Minos11]|uniref:ABC transporter permease subunit n=1 Tax=Synechococcus sp. Minos11 TaxID=221341 RepID=UPI000301E0B3|nr:branched-chain amino acid ABC transporter permease [Synechococcus sp. Minos11]OUW40682.1 MAG: branched-chain amino acid ABC transporter permease [Synechococcus sp. TMED185]QNJ10077.1 ABC-type urea transporter/ permease component [Synechococcus sp. Minos11]RCL62828.1 MAG: branched-chain amino acid ABC transporter permease [Synechococcus sp. MED-G67]